MYNKIPQTERDIEIKHENNLYLQIFMKKEARIKCKLLEGRLEEVESTVKMYRSDRYIAESKAKRLQRKIDKIVKLVREDSIVDLKEILEVEK